MLMRHDIPMAHKASYQHMKESLERNQRVRPPVTSAVTLFSRYLTTYTAFLGVLTAAFKSNIHNKYICAVHFNVALENVRFSLSIDRSKGHETRLTGTSLAAVASKRLCWPSPWQRSTPSPSTLTRGGNEKLPECGNLSGRSAESSLYQKQQHRMSPAM